MSRTMEEVIALASKIAAEKAKGRTYAEIGREMGMTHYQMDHLRTRHRTYLRSIGQHPAPILAKPRFIGFRTGTPEQNAARSERAIKACNASQAYAMAAFDAVSWGALYPNGDVPFVTFAMRGMR